MQQDAPGQEPRGSDGKRAVVAGVSLGLFCIVLVLLPLAWGRSSINKYFVAFGLFGLCVAVSLIAHGGWDWIRGRG